jgi:protein required for attachment to host cells
VAQTWIVVADSTRARLFALAERSRQLLEIDDLVHPESRVRDRNLVSDRPGRTFDSRGRGRHAKQPEHSAHEVQVEEFAQAVARRLERGRRNGKFDRLVVVAGPRFAGRLHGHLSAATRALIRREVHKNLVRRTEATILAAVSRREKSAG